jgi:hypothetical protein
MKSAKKGKKTKDAVRTNQETHVEMTGNTMSGGESSVIVPPRM